MNYLVLKSIIETTVANFFCAECGKPTTEKDISVMGIASNSLNLEVHCPHCRSVGVLKAEVGLMAGQQNSVKEGLSIDDVVDFEKKIHSHPNVSEIMNDTRPADDVVQDENTALHDKDILALRKKLKSSHSVEDFLTE